MPTKKPILSIEIEKNDFMDIVNEYLNKKGYCLQEVNRGKIEQALEDPKKYLCAILGGLKTDSKKFDIYESYKDGLKLVSKLKEKGLYTLVLSGANSKILTKCQKELGFDNGWVLRKPFDFKLLGNYIENIQINQER